VRDRKALLVDVREPDGIFVNTFETSHVRFTVGGRMALSRIVGLYPIQLGRAVV
jgi:hypothetical protein